MTYNSVLREVYSKEVSSKSIIDAQSALSKSAKRTILTQEVLRVFKNCNYHDGIEDGVIWVQQEVRHDVVDSALKEEYDVEKSSYRRADV